MTMCFVVFCVPACISVAACSMLDAPVDWGLIQQLGSKAAVVYNPQDPWFQQYGAMQEVLPEVEVRGGGWGCNTANDGTPSVFTTDTYRRQRGWLQRCIRPARKATEARPLVAWGASLVP